MSKLDRSGRPLKFRDTDFKGYGVLMQYRIQEILLVASAYNSFILEEDGQFTDRISGEYVELRLSGSPNIKRVNTGAAAVEALASKKFDLVLTTGHFADMGILELTSKVKAHDPELPVVVLTFDRREAAEISGSTAANKVDYVFVWSGDPRILLALVKTIEDRRNVQADTRRGRVRVVLVVEDSPSFYSSYLPIIYTEVMEQTRRLMADRLNAVDRISRMRARPKILLARTYEEAEELYSDYKNYLLGIITDMRFPRGGRLDPTAGAAFVRLVREKTPDLPVLLQSADLNHSDICLDLDIPFANKNSRGLLHLLRRFMVANFGFGAFIFRDGSGREICKAENLRELVTMASEVPGESIRLHASRNDFSHWLMARSEFALASEVRPRRVSDFQNIEDMRTYLVDAVSDFLIEEQRGQITEFSRDHHQQTRDFAKLGTGSLGGKARSIAFLGALLASSKIHSRFEDVRIIVPRSTVLCTDVFEDFIHASSLRERAMNSNDDEAIMQMFLAQPLPEALTADLSALLEQVTYPLAVRSSSLLEDSRFEPFAGVYSTYLLPNNAPSLEERVEQLSEAIRLIYASTYMQEARMYMKSINARLEEERMAVVIQRLVGTGYGDRFYPTFSGVARSHNFYPVGNMKAEDGIVSVALGLGRTVVEGSQVLNFCPLYPKIPMRMVSPEEVVKNSQRQFYCLNLHPGSSSLGGNELSTMQQLELDAAEQDGTLDPVGGTYVVESGRVYDSLSRKGTRVVNFSGVLKHGLLPLAGLMQEVLELVSLGVGTDVEIEFAVCMDGRKGSPELALVQCRPAVSEHLSPDQSLEPKLPGEKILFAGRALGTGVTRDIRHIVYIHPDRYDRTRTLEMARSISRINETLMKAGQSCMLLAPGRWGSSDRFLGVPVSWKDICTAQVIAEISMPGYRVDPSQGSHFFHNITSLGIGYFTIDVCGDADDKEECARLDWIDSLPAVWEDEFVRHVELPVCLEARIDSRKGKGVVIRMPFDYRPNGSPKTAPLTVY